MCRRRCVGSRHRDGLRGASRRGGFSRDSVLRRRLLEGAQRLAAPLLVPNQGEDPSNDIVCKVSLLFSALFAIFFNDPYYLVLYMQSVLIYYLVLYNIMQSVLII